MCRLFLLLSALCSLLSALCSLLSALCCLSNVTQVQNAYSSTDITFMHNRIEHILSHEVLNGEHSPRVRVTCGWAAIPPFAARSVN